MSEVIKHKEVWVYIGRRWGAADQKIYHAYIDADGLGEERAFAKRISGNVIGGRYELEVTRDDNNVKVTLRSYRYLSLFDHPNLPQWVAEDSAIGTMAACAVRERKDKQALGSLTLDSIRVTINKLPSQQHRRALIANVLDYLAR